MASAPTGRKAKTPAIAKAPAPHWRMSDLPVAEQVELKDRIAEAKRGDTLIDFDEAMEVADRLTDEVLAVATGRGRAKPA